MLFFADEILPNYNNKCILYNLILTHSFQNWRFNLEHAYSVFSLATNILMYAPFVDT